MLRQLRSICWNEKMPVHAPPLDCSGDCFRYPNCVCNFLSKINLSLNRAAFQCLALAVSSRMSVSPDARGLSASLRKRTSDRLPCYVRLVPKADICIAAESPAIRSPRRRGRTQVLATKHHHDARVAHSPPAPRSPHSRSYVTELLRPLTSVHLGRVDVAI